MAVEAQTPVSAIEGIGSATAAMLGQIGVHTVVDLLRGRSGQLHEAVRSLASVGDVQSWKSMAALLEVDVLMPQWAEALVRNGVHTVSGLFRKSMSEIHALMNKARTDGIISTTPTSEQIAEMLKDAAVLSYSGSLTGTVFNTTKQPIRDVTIRVGRVQTQSDERGRFRLLRIPLGSVLPMRIEHPDYQAQVVEHPRIVRDLLLIQIQTFRLEVRDAPPRPVFRLSELNGDVVPVAPDQALRQTMVEIGELQPNDILMVQEFYQTAPDARLVSKFKISEDGVVIVRTVRVPLTSLPGEVHLGDYFRFAGTGFLRTDMTPARLHRQKVRLRMQKEFAGRAIVPTREEAADAIRDQLHYLLEHGYFARRRTE